MEPRTRILFISYIVIVLAIVAIGVVPHFLNGHHKKSEVPTPPAAEENVSELSGKAPAQKTGSFVSIIHVIDTNKLTKSVRFQIPTDGVFFEEQNDHLYEIMKDKKGRDILLSYQKRCKNNEVFYNFRQAAEIR